MVRISKKFVASLLLVITTPLLIFAPAASAASSTVAVTPLNNQGWVFNPDPNNATPYEFNQAQASTGDGSLYVLPIGATPAQKFIAEKTIATPVSAVESIAYDFQIAGNGTSASANQFYMNVYANFGESAPNKFYDCRYDIVASEGSTTEFTTITFDPSQSYPVTTRGSSPHTCPASPSDMQGLSATGTAVIRAFTLNVGDTSAGDTGLASYLDNVVVNTTGDDTTYDLEPIVKLANKEACKTGGWMQSDSPTFKNQGDCVSYFASKSKNKDQAPHFAYGSLTLSGPTQQLNFSAVDKGASSSDLGSVYYANPSAGLVYNAPLTCVNVSGNTTTFAYVIPATAPVAAGTWVVWKVVDGASDSAGFTTASDMASANMLCESGTFTPTNYPITIGNVVVQ